MIIHYSPLFTIINNKKINLIHNGEYLFIEWWISIYWMLNIYLLNGEYLFIEWWISIIIDNLFQSIYKSG